MNTAAHVDSNSSPEIVEALSNFDVSAIQRYQKEQSKPNLDHLPGGTGWPVMGHTYWFITDMQNWMRSQYEQYGSVFRFRMPAWNSVMLIGPDANRLVLQNENKIFSNYLAWGPIFRTLFDNSVLERDFADHKTMRKTLQLAFKRQAIEGHMELMNPLLQQGITKWKLDQPIKAKDHVKKLLLDAAANIFLGVEIGPEADRLNQAFEDILSAGKDPFKNRKLWFMPYAKGLNGRKILKEFVEKNIDERRRVERRDLFSQLCHLKGEDGKLLTDAQIEDHILFILFAAHDTTTSALSTILYTLASNKDWQEQLRQEMLGLNKDTVEFDDIDKLEKTTLIFKEALRMYPALSMIPRFALKDFEFGGQRIPANTLVWVSPTFTHNMSEHWSNPEDFDPLRFSAERAEDKKDFFQYIPFGGGAHKCLGLHFAQIQAKVFLFHLLRSYKVTKNPKMTHYKYNSIPMTLPTDGLPLTFSKL